MNRLQSRSRCMALMAIMAGAAIVLLLCAHYALAAAAVCAAAGAWLSSLRECRICHCFATLASAGAYGMVCPTCARMIAEGRQQELLERRSGRAR